MRIFCVVFARSFAFLSSLATTMFKPLIVFLFACVVVSTVYGTESSIAIRGKLECNGHAYGGAVSFFLFEYSQKCFRSFNSLITISVERSSTKQKLIFYWFLDCCAVGKGYMESGWIAWNGYNGSERILSSGRWTERWLRSYWSISHHLPQLR